MTSLEPEDARASATYNHGSDISVRHCSTAAWGVIRELVACQNQRSGTPLFLPRPWANVAAGRRRSARSSAVMHRQVLEDSLFKFEPDGCGIDFGADVADLTGHGWEGCKICVIVGQIPIGIQRQTEVSGRIVFVEDRLACEAAPDEVAAEVPPGRVDDPADVTESRSCCEILTVVEVGGGDLVVPVVMFRQQPIGLGFLRRDKSRLAATLGKHLDLCVDPPRQLDGT